MSDVSRSLEPLQPQHARDGTLQALIETLLDRGLVIDADITVSVGGVELLGIRVRAALASFDTAARYGLDFPSGTNRDTPAWKGAFDQKETCPRCGKVSPRDQLLNEYCPWCGWRSAHSMEAADQRRAVEDHREPQASEEPESEDPQEFEDAQEPEERPTPDDRAQRRRD
jgi:ssDNA-binding Zn-finger/Zn-ribbon topoisomerase 1